MSIKQFLTIFSVSISLWILASCASTHRRPVCCDRIVFGLCNASDSLSSKYRLDIRMDNINISGILLLKQQQDTIRSVFMNEFGIKVFDLEMGTNFSKINISLEAVNKWYIRKQLQEDFHFLLSPLCQCSGVDSIRNLNTRYGVYTYSCDTDGFTASKTKNKKWIAKMKMHSDRTVEMQNIHRNISYKLTILAQTN